MSAREQGIVKWLNDSKGCGVNQRDSGEDIFVHFRAIQGDGYRSLKDGEKVEFSVVEGDKGLQAEEVRKVGE
ncbi:MAG: cold shock domain-containing protein [Psychrobacter sp.]|nr:cold shock domain-containing protein [Psychrobacter sp.]